MVKEIKLDLKKWEEMPERKRTIIMLLNELEEPVKTRDFVNKHIFDFGLKDDKKGRHTANTYINRMVSQKIVAKRKINNFPYIYLPPKIKELVSNINTTEVMDISATVLEPSERKQKAIKLLENHPAGIQLSVFVKKYFAEFGYKNTVKNLSSLRAFLYRMKNRNLIRFVKKDNIIYVSNIIKKQVHTDEASEITKDVEEKVVIPETAIESKPQEFAEATSTTSAAPAKTSTLSLPVSLEALIETKNKIMEAMEALDNQLEEIIDKKKELKKKRDELLVKMRDLF